MMSQTAKAYAGTVKARGGLKGFKNKLIYNSIRTVLRLANKLNNRLHKCC